MSALKDFNAGFDYASEIVSQYNQRNCFSALVIRSTARGLRHDKWWIEGVDAALEWAENNWKSDNSKLQGYRTYGLQRSA